MSVMLLTYKGRLKMAKKQNKQYVLRYTIKDPFCNSRCRVAIVRSRTLPEAISLLENLLAPMYKSFVIVY